MDKIHRKDTSNIIMLTILGIYLYFTNVANYTIYSSIAIVILTGISIFNTINIKKVYFNIYFFLYILFLLYQFVLVLFRITINEEITMNAIKSMIINFIVLLCIYNIVIYIKDMKKIMKLIIIITTLSMISIMFILRGSLLTGRLAHAYGEDAVSYYFFNKPVAMSSNGIAFTSAVAVMFAIYIYHKERRKKYLLVSIFLIFGIMLTGSRKGILVLALYMGYIVNLIYKNKIAKKILIVLMGGIIIWLAIMKIPALYDIIGERLIALIDNMLGNSTSEGSIVARERYKNYALNWISERPLMGYGIGTFKSYYGNVTENNYLEMMVSGGILGTIIYYSYAIPALKRYFKYKNKDDKFNIISIIMLSIFVLEYGSVTYLARNYLIFIVIYFAYSKIIKEKNNIERRNNN